MYPCNLFNESCFGKNIEILLINAVASGQKKSKTLLCFRLIIEVIRRRTFHSERAASILKFHIRSD